VRAGVLYSRATSPGDAAAGPARTRMAWLLMDSVMAVLVLASTARYFINHGLNDLAPIVLPGAVALLVGYLARRLEKASGSPTHSTARLPTSLRLPSTAPSRSPWTACPRPLIPRWAAPAA